MRSALTQRKKNRKMCSPIEHVGILYYAPEHVGKYGKLYKLEGGYNGNIHTHIQK